MNRVLLEAIGSPFADRPPQPIDDAALLALYDSAFENRVALLLLTRYRRPGWSRDLEFRYQHLLKRQQTTVSVIADVSRQLDTVVPGEFVVFKSLKPFPATPNDTDVLVLAPRPDYERAYQHLLDSGYFFHEWAPQQRTVCDPRGAGKIGKGKKGGTYYIDLYQEVSTDYFAYMNKERLRPFVRLAKVEGVDVPVLRPEPELAIVLFHNVFPERTFQVEHFVLQLHYMANPEFDLELFRTFAEVNHMKAAVRANVTLAADIHQEIFGFVPAPLVQLLDAWGRDVREDGRFAAERRETPYLFSPGLFWRSFAGKLQEWYSLRTAFIQFLHLADPRFFRDVVRSIRLRMADESVYKAE